MFWIITYITSLLSLLALLVGLVDHRLQRVHVLPVPTLPSHQGDCLLGLHHELLAEAEFLFHYEQPLLLYYFLVHLFELESPVRNGKHGALLALLFLGQQVGWVRRLLGCRV